jgi:hypothetical protein
VDGGIGSFGLVGLWPDTEFQKKNLLKLLKKIHHGLGTNEIYLMRYLDPMVGLKKYNVDIKLLNRISQWKTYYIYIYISKLV